MVTRVLPVCFACGLANGRKVFAVQIMRSTIDADGTKRSRSIPARLCRRCIEEIAARVSWPPLPMNRGRRWVHRQPPRVNTCVACGQVFRCWHERARYCSQRCRHRMRERLTGRAAAPGLLQEAAG
jgi:hypothetical protein